MNNRGQFFLIGALIIIVIIFGVATVYNSINSTNSEQKNTENLANNIKEESFYVINNAYYNNLAESQISQNLNNLTSIYSKANPSYNISYIYYSNGNFGGNNYYNSLNTSIPSSDIFTSQDKITLSLNNINHTFNLTKGYNFFVIVQKDNNNEKYIAKA